MGIINLKTIDQIGMVVADANLDGTEGISVSRDLGFDNRTTPAAEFNYRPDFIINMPGSLWKTRFEMEELLP